MSAYHVQVYSRKNEPVENLIKRFMRKVRKEGIKEECRERMFFEKPSDKKRRLSTRRRQILRRLKQKEETI